MKVKSKKESKINNAPKREDRNGFPDPITAQCFKCQKQFWIKWVVPQKDYSKKNDWEYWTGEQEKGKICNFCLRSLYYNKSVYWNTIKNLRKRANLAGYVNNNYV